MSNLENKDVYKAIPEFLRHCIKKEIELATEEELAKAQARLEKRKAQIIAGVVLNAQKILQVDSMTDKVVITVKLEDNDLTTNI